MTGALLDRPAVSTEEEERQIVTLLVADQLCGLPVLAMREILGEQTITRVPLAPDEVAGSLNLRGRIVTAVDLRRRLGLPPAPPGTARMSVVAEQGGELYALLVDHVAEVIHVPASAFERNPSTLPPSWARFSAGVCRLERRLLVVLELSRLLAVGEAA
jgi:purine-binding chemotaxis protein CheW